MSRLSPSSARCYGLARVARVWSVSRASVYRSLKETPPNPGAENQQQQHRTCATAAPGRQLVKFLVSVDPCGA